MASVLFVDDDPGVLDGLRRLLHRRLPDVTMAFAGGGRAALDHLRAQRVDVVVCDVRMPEVDGAVVLERAWASQPQAARIVLSGCVDQEPAMRSIRYAHRFLAKPHDGRWLADTVADVVQAGRHLGCPDLQWSLGSLVTLPSRPGVLADFRRLLDGAAAVEEVAAVVASDLALTVKTVQLASCCRVDDTPVGSVAAAVGRIGLAGLRAVAGAGGVFDDRSSHGWAPTVAQVVADTAQRADALSSGILPMAGVGLLAVAACAPDAMRVALAVSGGDPGVLADAEVRSIGASHRQAADYLLRLWGLAGYVGIEAGGPGSSTARAVAELSVLARATVPVGRRHHRTPA